MSWLYFQINLLLVLTLAGKGKRCVQFFVIFVVFRFQATLQAELEKETARFQKKFLQETVSETINFQRNLSWNIMTSQCLYPNVVRSHCWWIFTAVPKRKIWGSLRFLLLHTRSIYDVGDMFTVSIQMSNKYEFFYLMKKFSWVSFQVDPNTVKTRNQEPGF